MKTDKVKVAFLVPYPLRLAPSQRFRVELFLPELDKANIHYKLQSFIDEKTWYHLYNGGGFIQKSWGVFKGFARRWKFILFDLATFEFVFIHREAAPVGPPVFEWIISKLFRKKLIYDFDDAIWIPNTSKVNSFASWFKACWKIKYICKWAYKVVGGNDYLCNYASLYNRFVVKIPTCVDTVKYHNRIKNQHTEKVVIGWTGSQSTLKFLEKSIPVLKELKERFDFEFVIIANQAPPFELSFSKFIPWDEHTEVDDLLQLNIGIMPLDDDPWCEGKCGFKLIQYLSLGIPAVASPIGVNKNIIDEGINGYLCNSKEEWLKALTDLIEDAALRSQMGKDGREKVITNYSIQSQTASFLNLFN